MLGSRGMTLSEGAQKRLATLLGGMLGESDDIAADVAAFFAEYLRRVPFLAAIGLRLMVWALIWLPIVFVGRLAPASELEPEVRERYLAKWVHAHNYYLREGFFLVKTVALLGWGAHPAVRARFSMPPVAVAIAPALSSLEKGEAA
jgi:hypothetical protein